MSTRNIRRYNVRVILSSNGNELVAEKNVRRIAGIYGVIASALAQFPKAQTSEFVVLVADKVDNTEFARRADHVRFD